MSSSPHIDNKKKDVLILGKSPTQGLEHTLTAEKLYLINFTKNNKNFCLNLYYNGANSYLFANGTEIIKFKVKHSKIATTLLCLGNISKDLSSDNMKNTGLNENIYDVSVDYDTTAVDNVLDIRICLMRKNKYIIQYVWVY